MKTNLPKVEYVHIGFYGDNIFSPELFIGCPSFTGYKGKVYKIELERSYSYEIFNDSESYANPRYTFSVTSFEGALLGRTSCYGFQIDSLGKIVMKAIHYENISIGDFFA